MDEFANEIDGFLRTAREAAEKLANDPNLAPDYAARQARELWAQAVEWARQEARERLAALEKRYGDLSERLAEEIAKTDAMLEPARVQAALTVAQIQADVFDDWNSVESVIRRAIATGDRHVLQAWSSIGLPALEKRLPSVPRLKEKPGELARLKELASEALAKLEPPALQKARREAEAAENALAELQSDLDRVNARWALRNGGRGPLDISEGTTTVEFPKDGKMRITYQGRWP